MDVQVWLLNIFVVDYNHAYARLGVHNFKLLTLC